MKFKMAEKSLFAILLRSPWWISLAIAAGIALVARVALPTEIAGIGMMGGFPFFVISVIAAWRQRNVPNASAVERATASVATMGWREFGTALDTAWRAGGWQVTRQETPGSDFLLQKGPVSMLVSARRWKAAKLGVEPLRELHAAMGRAEVSKGLWIGLGEVSPNARTFAKQNGIALMTPAELAALLA
jgi:restriction system protein